MRGRAASPRVEYWLVVHGASCPYNPRLTATDAYPSPELLSQMTNYRCTQGSKPTCRRVHLREVRG